MKNEYKIHNEVSHYQLKTNFNVKIVFVLDIYAVNQYLLERLKFQEFIRFFVKH